MKKIPKLRFKEFSEEWEEKKLEKIFEIFNGYAFSSKENVKKGIILLKIANIGITKLNKNDISFLPINFLDLYSKFLLKKGDIVIALTRPLLNGKLKIAEINEYFNNCLLNQRVGKILTKENKKFIYNMLQNKNYIKKIENNISGSDPPNLSTESIKDINITIPILQEQEKIADFLSSVDVKLDLTEKKLELLKNYKKGIMQKIFSQELKFKDENGNDYAKWEEKKLENIVNINKGKQLNKEFLLEYDKYPVINGGILPSGYTDTYNYFANTITISEGGNSCGYVNFIKKDFWAGGHCYILEKKENINYKYLYQILKNNESNIMELRVGSGLPNIQKKSINEYRINVSMTLEEQQKIADFLFSIDDKIEKLSSKLEELKEFKKGLLQQMFV